MSALPDQHPPMPIVDHPTLRLRRFVPADAIALAVLHDNPGFRRYLMDDVDLSRVINARAFIRGLQQYYAAHPGLGYWALERLTCRHTAASLAADDATRYLDAATRRQLTTPVWQFIGWFNLSIAPGDDPTIEAGARLHPSAWGSHIATIVGEQVIRHGLLTLGCPGMALFIDPDNRSAVYRGLSLGFGDARDATYAGKPAIRLWMDRQRHADWQGLSPSARRRQALADCLRLTGAGVTP